MNSDIAYVTTYPCPQCGEMLEANVDEWQDWLLCPVCGKAGRPPYERRARSTPVEDVLYIGTFTTGPASAPTNGSAAPVYAPAGLPPAPSGVPHFIGYDPQPSMAKRVLLGVGLLLSIVLALVSVVQKNPAQAGVFGFVAFLLLIFLAQSSRQA